MGSESNPNEYFSDLAHTKQLSFMTFCDVIAGIKVSFQTYGNEWTDRHGKQNIYLDIVLTYSFLRDTTDNAGLLPID